MKLEISLVGDYYAIGLIRLDKLAMKAGRAEYGSKGWNRLLTDIAVLHDPTPVLEEAKNKLGRPIELIYSIAGVHLQSSLFGIEVFTNGEPAEFEHVDSKMNSVNITGLTNRFTRKDILGICRSHGIGSVTFRWNEVEDFDDKKIQLDFHDIHEIMNEENTFELVYNIKYDGERADKIIREDGLLLRPMKHYFHMR